jgi:DNA-binding NtrC family response regulator
LGKLGYNVLLAETPASALQLARQHAGAIDLLLTDVVMPQMDGRDLVGHIARRCPGIACVQMSGYTGDATARDGVLHDELGFLPKPFSCRELAEKVRRALDERKRTMP